MELKGSSVLNSHRFPRPYRYNDQNINISHFSVTAKMGAAISAARDSLREADEAAQAKAKQDLDIPQKMVDAVLDRYDAELNA